MECIIIYAIMQAYMQQRSIDINFNPRIRVGITFKIINVNIMHPNKIAHKIRILYEVFLASMCIAGTVLRILIGLRIG